MDVDSSEVATSEDNHSQNETEDSDCSHSTTTSSRSRSKAGRNKRRGRKSTNLKVKSGDNVKSKLNYKCTNFLKEDHKQPIFGVQFYQCLDESEDPLMFGTVGSNRASIYKCENDGKIALYQSVVDSDPEEIFYSCTWTYNSETFEPLLCFAGAKGILHVYNAFTRQFVTRLQGHGSAVNDVKSHPLDPQLVITSSKDHTVRLWNIHTEVCVAIFGGVEGHRDEVLSVDFDVLATRLVTCGMDHSVKFWSLERCRDAIDDAHRYSVNKQKKVFGTLEVHYPEFTTRDVHRNYIDCCAWLGDLVISKSCDNEFVCWQSKQPLAEVMSSNKTGTENAGVFIIHKFDIAMCEIWFIRFAIDFQQTVLALGNQTGKVYLYDLNVGTPRPTILSHNKCTSTVRQVSFNAHARHMIAVCDDGTVWRWDRQT